MKLNDFTLGVLLLAGAIAIFLSATQFSAIPGQAYGAATMPKTIALLTFGLGLYMTGRSVAAGARRPAVVIADWARSPASVIGLVVSLALIVFYILFSDLIGFVPTAVFVMAALMLTLRVKPITAILVSIVAAVIVQQAFGRLLLVPLPRNTFLGFLW